MFPPFFPITAVWGWVVQQSLVRLVLFSGLHAGQLLYLSKEKQVFAQILCTIILRKHSTPSTFHNTLQYLLYFSLKVIYETSCHKLPTSHTTIPARWEGMKGIKIDRTANPGVYIDSSCWKPNKHLAYVNNSKPESPTATDYSHVSRSPRMWRWRTHNKALLNFTGEDAPRLTMEIVAFLSDEELQTRGVWRSGDGYLQLLCGPTRYWLNTTYALWESTSGRTVVRDPCISWSCTYRAI